MTFYIHLLMNSRVSAAGLHASPRARDEAASRDFFGGGGESRKQSGFLLVDPWRLATRPACAPEPTRGGAPPLDAASSGSWNARKRKSPHPEAPLWPLKTHFLSSSRLLRRRAQSEEEGPEWRVRWPTREAQWLFPSGSRPGRGRRPEGSERPSGLHSSRFFLPGPGMASFARLRALGAPLRLGSSAALLQPPVLASARPASASMATLNQMHRLGRHKLPPPKPGLLDGCPQLKAVVLKTLIRKPKKPNSANRKCVRVRLSTGKEAIAFVPGEGHNLQEHNIVMVEGGRTQDLPGVKLKVVRGKYDCAHVGKKK
ncbi:small ribosomal subunit protein uS12m [Heteronotia binoei]|uniref:small ribosomal subunit protein uS12m n=1 Tax=Heteronotia binoei TaxID=13085 RepID=UPI00292D05EE|nr:small ribosomal subunit protein uS12m [Heteronotia binoei]